jgi:hypothetical protein
MSQRAKVETSRQHLNQLAEDFETGLSERYALQFWTPEKPNLYRSLRKKVGRLLRWLGLMRRPPGPSPPKPWLTQLKHVDYGNAGRPLLIWAMDIERDELQNACEIIKKLQSASPGWAPVLVTDVADFAFFSRLNWLVEYVPSLAAPADKYSERKLRYLAWRYRDVPALPITSDIKEDMLLEDLLVD